MTNKRQLFFVTSMAATIALGLTACFVSAEPAPVTGPAAQPAPVVADSGSAYTPLYYDGYAVYYDNGGRPYYWLNGGMVWIPSSYAYYGRYTNYYRQHRTHYLRWNRTHGTRYRTYRHNAGNRHYRGGNRGMGVRRGGPARRRDGMRGPRGGMAAGRGGMAARRGGRGMGR